MPLDGTLQEVEYGTILNAAADLIERDGWCQYQFSKGTQVCLVGAIERAAGYEAYASVLMFFQKRQRIADAVNWNDAERRTKAEVIAALRGER